MKPVNSNVMEVTNTLQGEAVEMSIHQDAMAHIMSVLTDLYSDPELAVIREYSTNALDSHVEAGVTRPIEVTLPSALSPYLRIRDFGLGLDADDIRDIYSRYGASTKRNSNDVVGMLGLGCKSALTYTDQFTITGTKNGVTTQVSVSRDEKGAGTMTIVAQYESDEESGVEILVPAKKYNEFESKARDFFRFWETGKVLINGEEPKRIDGMWLTDDLLLTEETDQSVVVMGNVAYPFNAGYNRNYRIVAYVKIGDVQFTPSREALQMTKHTEKAIETVLSRVDAEKVNAANRLVAAAGSPVEAVKIAINAQRMLGLRDGLQYNGKQIPDAFQLDDKATPFVVADGRKRYGRKGWDRTRRVPLNWLTKVEFIVGYNGSDLSPTKREKMTLWQQGKGDTYIVPESYVMVEKLDAEQRTWIDSSRIHNWARIEELKLPKKTADGTVSGRPTGSYKGYLPDGSYTDTLLAGDIDANDGVFFKNSLSGISHDAMQVIRKDFPKATFVMMGNNRVAKFQRDFPNAENVYTKARALADNWAKNLTADDMAAIYVATNYYESNKLKALDEAEILDPALVAEIKLAKGTAQGSTTVKAAYSLYDNYVTSRTYREYKSATEKYPLLTEVSGYGTLSEMMQKHITLYVNAAYSAEKGTV